MKVQALMLLLVVPLSACIQGGADGTSVEVTTLDDSYEQAWERFRATARPHAAGGLVADGDAYFHSEGEMRAYFDEHMSAEIDKAHAIQRTTDGFIPKYSFPNHVDIKYCISNAFSTAKQTWVDRMRDATRVWEQVANVRFKYLSAFDSNCSSSTTQVDFAVVKADNGNGYFGCNKLLWWTCATGSGVLEIDTTGNMPGQPFDVTFGGFAPALTPTGLLRHELGHILGLRHEHPWRPNLMTTQCLFPQEMPVDPGMVGGLQLTSVAYDQMSVMHYRFDGTPQGAPQCNGNKFTDYTLTATDGYSVQRLYGMHPAWVNQVNAIASL